jgi:hypothetical protein
METRVGSPKSLESKELFLHASLTHELTFSQALFSFRHCFLFQKKFKSTKGCFEGIKLVCK